MARHRSPQGRRTHLGLPLSSLATAAGAGGAGTIASAPDVSLAPRVIATVFAGGVLAAAGQTALSSALPLATDGANVLKLSVQELIGTPAAPAPLVALSPAVGAPVIGAPALGSPAAGAPAEPTVVDVGELVKAAELHRRAAAPVARTPAPPAAAVEAPIEDGPPAAAPAVEAGDVQMVDGRVTSGFGGRWGRQHRGVDIAAPIGTPIRVPLAGDVIASGPASGFGLWVRVRHDDGTVTTYGHVNRAFVGVGDRVAAGEEIAEVGNRGHSTGPHLHMEVQTPAGTTVNPRPWLDGHGIGY